ARAESLVANKGGDGFYKKNLRKSLLHQFTSVRRSALRANGDRKPPPVRNCHDLSPFTSLGFAHAGAPFFAGAKLPSMKASSRSNPKRLRGSSASASNTPRITPERTHCWKRRWQVW